MLVFYSIYPMKIAICFWGLTRNLKHTHESIQQHILHVLKSHDIEYKIFMHTYVFYTSYDNPRAAQEGEVDEDGEIKLDFEEYKLLDPDFVQIDNQDKIKYEIDLFKYRSQKDPWDSDYISLDNFLCAMYSKKQLGMMVEKSDIDFDYVLYLRPDIQYLNDFNIDYFSLTTETHVCTPNFHLFPKLNDRLCLLKACNHLQYSQMFDLMYEYSVHRELHSETFQYYVMTQAFKWKIVYIPFHFNRVRANGKILDDARVVIEHEKNKAASQERSKASKTNPNMIVPDKEEMEIRSKKTIKSLFKKKDATMS